MKKLGIALLASALLFTGCELLNGKKEDDNSGGGQQGGGAAGMDLSTMVQAYGPKMLKGAAVGMKVKIESKAGGQTNSWTVAIVGEEGDNWLVESSAETMAYGKDSLVGLVVQKSDGKILSGVVGKKGEAGKEIKVNNTMPGKATAAEGKEPEVVDCKLALGTFPAYYTEAGPTKMWTGSEGDMKGVLLKMESAQGGKELKEKPSMVDVDLGGTTVKARKLVYDNGDVMMNTEDATVMALNGGLVKTATKQSELSVVMVANDAKPELKWGEEKAEEKKEEKK